MNYFKRVLFTLSLFQFMSLIISRNEHSWNYAGEECINGCERRGLNQYWCYTAGNGWQECFKRNIYENGFLRGKTYISFKNIENSNYEMVVKTDPEYENICVTNDPFCLNCSNSDKIPNGKCLSNELIMEHYFTYLSSLIGCEPTKMLLIDPRKYHKDDPVNAVLFRNLASSIIRLEAIQGFFDYNSGLNSTGKYLRNRLDFTEFMLKNVKKYHNENCGNSSSEVDTLGGYPMIDETQPLEKVIRGTGNVWKDLEETINRFFKSYRGKDRNVIWKVICFYGSIEDLSPQKYWLSFLFYSSDPILAGANYSIEKIIENI